MYTEYIRINWKDFPEEDTPLSADNLNRMDKGIETIDKQVEALYNLLNDKEDGARLITPFEIEKLSKLMLNEDGSVLISDFPIGTSDKVGGVKSSKENNSIFIEEDGRMSVNKINISKLVQDDTEKLVFNAGDSSTK